MQKIINQPEVTITNIIWSFDQKTQKVNVLLIKRADFPFKDYWALPETYLRETESADQAALRLVREKIGLELPRFYTEQLETFTNPLRSVSAQRQIALAYMTFLPDMPTLNPGYGATAAQWFQLETDPQHNYLFTGEQLSFNLTEQQTENNFYHALQANHHFGHLAFDHEWLLKIACLRIRNKLDYQPNILRILGDIFTLKAVRIVYAAFLKRPVTAIDNSNFRKTHQHFFQEVGSAPNNGPGRPAHLYRLKKFGDR
ncbi:NrtR DNA-binding winged helix domain-containing protein [Liquorilactobacillus ghanensis]|uniref:NrtR DNA-binding winged helix domain-containing protein n=1 Tax=Liquorilactobacillus ghanensis TaxID=399370 RepID=UPI0039E7BDC5